MSAQSSVTIFVPQQLRGYTSGTTTVSAEGSTVDAALTFLDVKFPGFKFRVIDEQGQIREHMRIFVNGNRIRSVDTPVEPGSELHLFGALSGG